MSYGVTPADVLMRVVCRTTAQRIFDGIDRGGLYKGSLLPVMTADMPLYDVIRVLDSMHASILPTSMRKITHCKTLFDKHVDANQIVAALERFESIPARMTPKMFQHSIKSRCKQNPQKIVLPEVGGVNVHLDSYNHCKIFSTC